MRTPRRVLGPISCAALLAALLLTLGTTATATPITDLVISEIMYEPAGFDDGREWVEIYNGTSSTVDLSDYSLYWGRNNLANSVALDPVLLAPGQTFLIGGPTSDANNGNPTFDQVYNFAPNLLDGNHGWQEDAVALVFDPTSTLMHIVVYGGNGFVTAFTDEQGNTAVAVNTAGLGQGDSLEYLGADTWQVQSAPTPNVQAASLPVPVPEPGSAMLLGAALLAWLARTPPAARRDRRG